MSRKAKTVDRASHEGFLIQHGMKKLLVEKLSDEQVRGLMSFAMDHIKASNLTQMLIQLASMELREKKGALKLAVLGIGTVLQLKDLTGEQIEKLADELESNKDEVLVRRALKTMLILSQQEKLYFKSGGVKGEYYMYQKGNGLSGEI